MPDETSAAPGRARGASPVPWLLAVVGVLIGALSLGYTLALRSALSAAQQAQRDAERHTQVVQAALDDAGRSVAVVTAPDMRRFEIPAMGSAVGVVYLSPSQGIVLRAEGLPPLEPGLGYELWIQPEDGAPVSLGMLTVESGAAVHAAALPEGVAGGSISVTVENEGGGGTEPHGAPVLIGTLALH